MYLARVLIAYDEEAASWWDEAVERFAAGLSLAVFPPLSIVFSTITTMPFLGLLSTSGPQVLA